MLKFYTYCATLLLLCASHTLYSQLSLDLNIIGDTTVGEPLTIEVVAYNSGGINRVTILLDGDYDEGQFTMECNGNKDCTFSKTITQEYLGSKTVWASMQKTNDQAFVRTSTILNFTCKEEYCPPDPTMHEFFEWMRRMKYTECITSRYIQFSDDAEFRNGGRFLPSMKTFLRKRPIFEDNVITVDFIDVIPTDTDATFKGLAENEADLCTPDPIWTELCPNPISADYKYLEAYLTKTFGVKVILNYIRREINYAEVLGTPGLIGNQYQFPIGGRRAYVGQFPTNSIVHWAIETWNERGVYDLTGAGRVAEIDYEPNTTKGLYITSHEWGHSLGLRNTTSVLPHPFQERNGQRAYFQRDGIMSNGYRSGTAAQDPLDPMERYAFEPTAGYLDSSTFVQDYADGIIGWINGEFNCDSVDVAIESLEIIKQIGSTTTVQFEINNNLSRNTGFVNLGLLNEQQEILELRTVEFVKYGLPTVMEWTIEDCDGTYTILADPLNKIVEKTKSNNVLEFSCTPSSTSFLEKEIQFQIYPNPTSDMLHIEASNKDLKAYLSIYNMNGILLTKMDFKEEEIINLDAYPQGLYLVQIKTLNQVFTKKIFKE